MPENAGWIAERTVREVIEARNLDAVYDIFSDDFVDHSPSPGQIAGREGLRKVLEEYLVGFPDLVIEIQETIVAGDRAATREFWRGTHNGVFRGIPATGTAVTRTVMHIFHIADGKIVAEWSEGTDLIPQLQGRSA